MRIIIIILISAVAFTLTAPLHAATTDRPNVVLIMADDMGYETVTANGGQTYQTPRIDQMAKQGMRFEHCISQPICTPSRVKIMTGRPNSRNYVRFGYLDTNAKTFGNLFKQHGYATCIVGKWQLSGGNFDNAYGDPARFGFDEYCLWQLNRRPNRYPNPGLEVNGKQIDYNNGEYGPDIVSDYACQFIEKNRDKPFLLYYPMMLPHWPFEPTPDSADWDPTARRGDKTEKGGGREQKYFVEMVNYTDKLVGKIIDKVDSLGLGEKTLIIFTGDNGTFTGIASQWKGRVWQGGKGNTRDNGTRVPLVVRWTGKIKPGQVNTNLIDFSDMLPTMADAVDAKVPGDWDVTGRSFLPQLLGDDSPTRDFVYVWYYRNGKPAATQNFQAGEFARTGQYKLYQDGRFFDVTQDYEEQTSLADQPNALTAEQKQIQTKLQQVIDQYTRPDFHEKPKTPKVNQGKNK